MTPIQQITRAPERLLMVGCIVGVVLLAIALVVSHEQIQGQMQQQLDGSSVVNLSGRQRMLSQRLTKSALRILSADRPLVIEAAYNELEESLLLLRQTHQGLLARNPQQALAGTNSAAIRQMFEEIKPSYLQLTAAAEVLLQHRQGALEATARAPVEGAVAGVVESEARFLQGMDRIVFQYDQESRWLLKQTEERVRWLYYAMLVLLLLEGMFIFLPLIRRTLSSMALLRTNQQHLVDTAAQLESTIEALRETQNNLLDVEKKAVLSSVVAGVTHDVNTPIGIGITAASALQQQLGEMQRKLESGTVRRSDMEDYQAALAEGFEMIMQNLRRASELIANFKQLAVDQSSESRRRFNLKKYLDDVLLAMNAKLRTTEHRIIVHCPDDLELDSCPGALYQIFSNLIMNSLIHGFEQMRAGCIQIDARIVDGCVELVYRDNGCGVSEEAQKVFFDPFYTTKKDRGGTGIGTHVIKNLVEKTLGGEITLTSKPDQGVCLLIRFPFVQSSSSNQSSSVSSSLRSK